MKRIILLACVLAVLAGLAGGIRLRLRRSGPDVLLTKARVALDAAQARQAERLAEEYLRRYGEHPAAYLAQGRARARLGKYTKARQALRRTIELQGDEAAATLALAETYVLPALRRLECPEASRQLPALRACVDDLEKANAILAGPTFDDPLRALPLQRMIGSNTIHLASTWRRIADQRSLAASIARAGQAARRARELDSQSQQAAEKARALEGRAAGILRGVLDRAKAHLGQPTDPARREPLARQADMAARHLVQMCMDGDDPDCWQAARAAISGLEEVSPVAFMLATMHEVRTRSFPNARSRRQALRQACEQIDARLDNVQRDDDRKELLQARAELALALGDHRAATRICREILAEAPSRPTARLLLAEAMMVAGNHDRAEEILFVLKADLPRSPEVAFAYARAAHAVGRLELAHEAMRAAVELDADHAPARRYLTEKYLLEGYLDQAYAHARDYYRRRPDDAAALRLLVEAARNTDRREQAADVLEKAVRRFPDRPDILQAAAEGYALLGDNARCLAAAAMAVQAHADDTDARLAVAKAMILLGQTQQAESMLVRELADNPDAATARFELARLYAITGRTVQAVEQCRAAVEEDPLSTTYRLALARAQGAALLAQAQLLETWGLYDQAANCLNDLHRSGYDRDPNVLLALGRVLAKLGKSQQARRQLQSIPARAPQYVAAQLALSRLAPSPAETLLILDGLSPTHAGRPEVLEQAMLTLMEQGQAAAAAQRFQAFIKEHCRGRRCPERPALLALQAMIESARPRQARALALRLADQTGRANWRNVAALLGAETPPSDVPGDKTADVRGLLIALANAARTADAEALRRRLGQLDRLLARRRRAVPPPYRILVALAAQGPTEARAALKDLPQEQLAGLSRTLAAGLIANADASRPNQQAAELLRASLALELGVPVLARQIATEVLAADPHCQWAAILAVRARRDPHALRKVLSMLAPADTPARRAIQAGLWLRRGQCEQAARAYQLAADAADGDGELRLKQAVALEKAGRTDEALALYRQLIPSTRGRTAANAANNAAYLAARLWPEDKARLSQAYDWACAAVRAAPDVHTYRDTKGWIAHLLGRGREACLELRRALRGMRESAEVHHHLAEAEAAAGRRQRAQWHRQAAERLKGGRPSRTARRPG